MVYMRRCDNLRRRESAITKYQGLQIKQVLQIHDLLLISMLSFVKLYVSGTELNIPSLLMLSSSCLWTLDCSVSSNTTYIAGPSKLMLGLTPWSKQQQLMVNIHGIRGSLKDLSRRSRARSRSKGVGGVAGGSDVLLSSTHLSNSSIQIVIEGWLTPLIDGLLKQQ